VHRHDDIVISDCGASGSCYAIVASEGQLWRCQEPALAAVVQEVALSGNSSLAASSAHILNKAGGALPPPPQIRPLAALPGDMAGGSSPRYLWAAGDLDLSRVFAAPKKGGAITELSYSSTSGQLIPTSELPMPEGIVSADAEWEALQVVNSRLLFAIAKVWSNNVTGFAWDLQRGTFAGTFSLPSSLSETPRGKPAPRALLCPAGASLFGAVMETTPFARPKGLDLYRWNVPDHLKETAE